MEGQPEHQPEKIKTYELVVEQYLGNHLRALGSLYQYNISGLISQTIDPVDGILFYDNVDDITARGAEFTVEGKWPTGFEGRVSYAIQTTRNDQMDQMLTNSPQHLVKTNRDCADDWGQTLRRIRRALHQFAPERS